MKHLLLSFLLFTSLAAHSQVGIGTATPAASAHLDLTSTTKGFLPPRMTEAQRNAIVSPAQGLMIYCTNCGSNGEPEYFNGTAWVNFTGSAIKPGGPTIGVDSLGGKVAYLLVSGDPGYDPNTPHGLIVSTSDLSSGIKWRNDSYTVTGATATAIGTGLSNTNTIITNQGGTPTSYAAGLARAHNGGGYTDWYLPSKDELNKLSINSVAIGGFSIAYYWSSTEYSSTEAWLQILTDGTPTFTIKANPFNVRAVRAF